MALGVVKDLDSGAAGARADGTAVDPIGGQRPPRWLTLRWIALVIAVGIAFHETLTSVVQQSLQGDPLAYLLFLFPAWGATIAIGTRARRQPNLPIYDRQLDWIIAAWLSVILLMVGNMLLPRLGVTEQLVRLDVFALMLFMMIGAILLFGTRATGSYWATWLFLACTWPLPYRLLGAALGGTTGAFAFINVGLSAIALVVAAGASVRMRIRSAGLALLAGGLTYFVIRSQSSVVVQILPSLMGLAVGGGDALRRSRRARKRRWQKRPTAVTKPVLATGALLAFSVGLSLFLSFSPATLSIASLPSVGAGWLTGPTQLSSWTPTTFSSYSWAPQYFGREAVWLRYWYRSADYPLGPALVADVLTATTVGPFQVYPSVSCYRLSAPFVQATETVELGGGVQASLFYANSLQADSPIDAEWVMLTWIWRVPDTGNGTFQRVTLLSVDGTASRLGIPTPASPGTNGSLRTTFSDILQSTPSQAIPAPSSTAIDRLAAAGREIVSVQRSAAARSKVLRINP